MPKRNEFGDRKDIKKLVNLIKNLDIQKINIMEVCGTHTMSIAAAGIKQLLPSNIRLISGPGCPVCVTPSERIDDVYNLSKRDNVIIATYGDMIRVPGTKKNISLERSRMEGADVRMVYSSMDALDIAADNPDKEVVFLGIGFETTAPAAAAVIKEAQDRNVKNFSVFSLHKRVEPVMRALLESNEVKIDGFMLPGHVAVITGVKGFEFLHEYKVPGVVGGFEPLDILSTVYRLGMLIEEKSCSVENEYTRIVSYEGNVIAQGLISDVFKPCDDIWRGMGIIKNSGLEIKEKYSDFDASKRFNISFPQKLCVTPCRCGDVLKGLIEPEECPLFGTGCVPDSPVGPCMVSTEGSCAAAYKYR